MITSGPVEVTPARDGAEWDAFVREHPASTAYHLWAWQAVFGQVFGHEPLYLAARQGGVIVGVLCSLPFVNYGGVLASSSSVAEALVAHARALAQQQRAGHVELRHVERQLPDAPVRQHKVTMWLPLADSPDAQWKALDNKARNQVRKAQKSGLTAVTGGHELLGDFYPVFAENMRDLGTPVYPRRFFEAVLDAAGTAGRVHVVRHEGRPAAASLTVDHPGRTEVPWASARSAYRQMSPNMLLYWHMLTDTVARGVPVFDFGRSTPGEGTYHFKKQWKAEAVPLNWEYALIGRDALPDQGPTNAKFRLAIEVWKRLPLVVANRLGPLVIGNIP
jgi:FemAB-related protein (PEP-CTERM system-associated)